MPILAIAMVLVFAAVGAVLVFFGRGGPASRPCPKCQRLMMPEWTQCMFCGAHPDLLLGKPGKLHFVTGPFAGQVLILEKAVTSIGSAPSSDVVLKDTGVSRRHAGVRKVEGGGYEVADLGSTNGTLVNGERKPKKALAVGDIIRVGATEMIFRV